MRAVILAAAISISIGAYAPTAFAAEIAEGAQGAERADVLATWKAGAGKIGDASATLGGEIPSGTHMTAGDRAVRVVLAKAPRCSLYLSPKAEMFIDEKTDGTGTSLVAHLVSGQLEADIADKGAYTDVHVLGKIIDVKVTGTLLVVERVKADTDYVALVHGKILVNVRKEVAEAIAALSGSEGVEMNSRQGLTADASGLGPVHNLLGRPQIQTSSASEHSSLQSQGDTPAPDSSWDTSAAENSTADGGVNGNSAGSGVEGGPQIGDHDVDLSNAGNDINAQISSEIEKDVSNEVTNQVINQAFSGPNPLSPPPSPP